MRDLLQSPVNQYRDVSERVERIYRSTGNHACGVFGIPSPIDFKTLHVIASSGEGWEHVSVSRPERTPTWRELEYVKRLFWNDDECAMQLHVPPSDHVDKHPHCLHMWRPLYAPIPRPPAWMVG